MGEMFGYIFGSLKSSETAIRVLQRTVRNQKKFNRNVALYTGAMTFYIISNELDKKEQKRQILELRKEIDELKHSEGE